MSPNTKNVENSTGPSPDEKDGEQKRREVSRDSTTRSPDPKRLCTLLTMSEDESQDSADNNISGDSNQKRDSKDPDASPKPPSPVTDENESKWRALVYAGLDELGYLEIEKQWSSLISPINLILDYMPERFSWDQLSEESREEISSWASNAEFHIEHSDKSRPRALFAGWIFRLLYDHLFSLDCHEKWSAPEWELFGRLQRKYRDHMEDCGNADIKFNTQYHNWRHISTSMLFDMPNGRWHTNPNRLYDIFIERLAPIALSKSRVNSKSETLHQHVEQLVYDAIRLDAMMIHSPTSVTMEMKDPGTHKLRDFAYIAPGGEMVDPCASFGGSQVVDFISEPSITIAGYEGSFPPKQFWEDESAYDSLKFVFKTIGYGYSINLFNKPLHVATGERKESTVVGDAGLPQQTQESERSALSKAANDDVSPRAAEGGPCDDLE